MMAYDKVALDWTVTQQGDSFMVWLRVEQGQPPERQANSFLIGQGTTKFEAILNATDVLSETRRRISDALRNS